VDIPYILGLLFMIGVGLYATFTAIDGAGLPTRNATATVVAREYRGFEKGYQTVIINSAPRMTPHVTGAKHILRLEIAGQRADAVVAKAVFDAVKPNDPVRIAFQRRRLTGLLRIVDVTPP
jgi:hypothetical protein